MLIDKTIIQFYIILLFNFINSFSKEIALIAQLKLQNL